MINQLKVERFKAIRFWLFYIAAGVLAFAGFLHGNMKFLDTDTTSMIFSYAVCDTSFIFISCLVTSWFMGNDFGNRTIHNEIKIGYSRFSVMMSRTIIVFLMSAIMHIVYVLANVIGFSVKWGFDDSVLSVENLLWLVVVVLQIFAIQSIMVLIVFTLKKTAVAISASVVCGFVLCNLVRNFTNSEIFKLSCISLAQNSQTDTLVISGVFAFALLVAFLTVAYLVFRKAEIK